MNLIAVMKLFIHGRVNKVFVRQLVIDFAVDNDISLANYFTSANSALVDQLVTFVHNEDESASAKLMYLVGESGVGKSHLGQALCQMAGDAKLTSQYLPMHEFCKYEIDVSEGMENYELLVVDDIDAIALLPNWQQALFDLINRVLENNHKIVFTSRQPPCDNGFTLPDLISRLQWGQNWRINPLSESQQLDMMIFRARCKGMMMSDEVAKFIYLRLRRDNKSIMRCLEKLDNKSLEVQRKLSIPFVKSVMAW